jgi:class 3 adenylate cyclase
MQCSSCSFTNPVAAKFCQECGARLAVSCVGCGVELPQAAKFCHECGQRTTAAEPAAAPAAPAEATPKAFAAGRYRIVRFVGEGAKKRVYQAYDERLDRDVALALIKSEGLDEAGRMRIRREAQAMARLGDHPNIVTVYDIGEALRERDKFFGRTVILAARIAAQAAGGEILVSALLKELTQSLGELDFGSRRELQLKGISEIQPVFPVEWQAPTRP